MVFSFREQQRRASHPRGNAIQALSLLIGVKLLYLLMFIQYFHSIVHSTPATNISARI